MPAELEQLAFEVGDLGDRAPSPAPAPAAQPARLRAVPGVLTTLAVAADQADNGVPRSRALLQLADAVDVALAAAIADAYESRPSWRKLSADLGIPFQTLHRRYAATVER